MTDDDARARPRAFEKILEALHRHLRESREFFRDRDPEIRKAFLPALALAAILFTRNPVSNYIFDEQEALLANPFVNGKVPWKDLLTRDFWGLPHDRSIGSYRPLPNVIWRAFWELHPMLRQPWALHWVNIVIHALNAACVARIALGITKNRSAAWFAGATFATFAILTEAVTGVVGIADVFGALGLLLAVLALETPLWASGPLVFLSTTLGLFAKESTLVAIPIVTWAALVTAPLHHPERPLRALRAFIALLATGAALTAYTLTRRRFFPTELPADLAQALPVTSPAVLRGFHAFLKWFAQPRLPQDPINNPLVDADVRHRISGALGVYAGGIRQLLLPFRLSGDYSFAAEPIPDRLYNARSVIGGVCLVGPPVVGFLTWAIGTLRERRDPEPRRRLLALLALVLAWVPVAYFPHSNIPVALPTVRAERFWYLPAAGAALGIGVFLSWVVGVAARARTPAVRFGLWAAVVLFLGNQSLRARLHPLDYMNDLVFWRATSIAVPESAKAHLNYGVMLGARNHLPERLVENRKAMELAPAWPMAHIYYGDTLCRMGRAEEAWPHYAKGFELGPNDRGLVSLALQCLYDKSELEPHRQEILDIATDHPGSWISYLGRDTLERGKTNGGVDPKYRPRGYNEGPAE